MPKITLRFLTINDEKEFMSALRAQWGDFVFAHYWESIAKENFEYYVNMLPDCAKGKYIQEGHIPFSLLFAFNEKNELVGRSSIRHSLTDFLLKVGGHVGYGVVPKHRQKGYATEILKESLEYIKKELPGIDRVLVTCDEDNVASRKTIIKNRGELENILTLPDKKRKMRFWIPIRR